MTRVRRDGECNSVNVQPSRLWKAIISSGFYSRYHPVSSVSSLLLSVTCAREDRSPAIHVACGMEDRVDGITWALVSPHCISCLLIDLHAVLFISVTFNKVMATEEVKLTKQVPDEALGAGVSGMVRSGCYELQIKETEAIFSQLCLVCRNACMCPITASASGSAEHTDAAKQRQLWCHSSGRNLLGLLGAGSEQTILSLRRSLPCSIIQFPISHAQEAMMRVRLPNLIRSDGYPVKGGGTKMGLRGGQTALCVHFALGHHLTAWTLDSNGLETSSILFNVESNIETFPLKMLNIFKKLTQG